MNLTNIRRGCLEGCILEMIRKEPTHSYHIYMQLKNQGVLKITPQSVYTITSRLEAKGLVKSTYVYSSIGPNRKLLSICEKGDQELVLFKELWQETTEHINAILQAG